MLNSEKYLLYLFWVGNIFCFCEIAYAQDKIQGIPPQKKMLRIYIPTLDEMKYKSTSVGFGVGSGEFSLDDTLSDAGGGVFGGMAARVATGYIGKRVSIELAMGYLIRESTISGWVGIGANTRIKDWNIGDEDKENSSLLRLGMSNDLVMSQNIANTKKLDIIARLKHQIGLEWFFYKRNQSLYFRIGFIGSPYHSVDYQNGSVAWEVGIKLFTAHNKGALFERAPSEIYEIPIREK